MPKSELESLTAMSGLNAKLKTSREIFGEMPMDGKNF